MCVYCSSSGDYAGFPGCGLLRLHSTYRHDLKIYASDEGRVQMTAAAFAKVRPVIIIAFNTTDMSSLFFGTSASMNNKSYQLEALFPDVLEVDHYHECK